MDCHQWASSMLIVLGAHRMCHKCGQQGMQPVWEYLLNSTIRDATGSAYTAAFQVSGNSAV